MRKETAVVQGVIKEKGRNIAHGHVPSEKYAFLGYCGS